MCSVSKGKQFANLNIDEKYIAGVKLRFISFIHKESAFSISMVFLICS